MAPFHTYGKGKEIDQSTNWSEPEWDIRGFYFQSRKRPNGELEYRYPKASTTEPPLVPIYPATLEYSPNFPETQDAVLRPDGVHHNALCNSSEVPRSPLPAHDPYYGHTPATAEYYTSSHYITATASSYCAQSSTSSADPDQYFAISSTSTGYADVANISQNLDNLSIHDTIPENYGPDNVVLKRSVSFPLKRICKYPNSQDVEELDPRYRVVPPKEQRGFWKVGRVFMMLWTEPARSTPVPRGGGTRNGSHLSTIMYGEFVYSEIRRFVVVSVGHGNNICSPIHTYSGQATLKSNLPEVQEHGVIYTSPSVPELQYYEASDQSIVQERLTKDPIKVNSERDLDDPHGTLHPSSRLNYSKLYTVENNLRVLNIGLVDGNSMASLENNSFVRKRSKAPEKPTKRLPRAASRKGSSKNYDQKREGSTREDSWKRDSSQKEQPQRTDTRASDLRQTPKKNDENRHRRKWTGRDRTKDTRK